MIIHRFIYGFESHEGALIHRRIIEYFVGLENGLLFFASLADEASVKNKTEEDGDGRLWMPINVKRQRLCLTSFTGIRTDAG